MHSDPRRNVLSAAKLNLRLPWLEHISDPDADSAEGPSSSKHARDLLAQQPELMHLAKLLRTSLGRDYDRVVKKVVSYAPCTHPPIDCPEGHLPFAS